MIGKTISRNKILEKLGKRIKIVVFRPVILWMGGEKKEILNEFQLAGYCFNRFIFLPFSI